MYIKGGSKIRIKRIFNMLIPLLGIVIIGLMLGIIWFWETSGREYYLYQEVIVFNKDIKGRTIINEKMLTTEEIEVDKVIDQAIIKKEDIIGLETKHFIPKKAQLHPYFFESKDLISEKDTFIFRIPNEWIYAVPNTLRRKDSILLFLTGENKESLEMSNSISTYLDMQEVEVKIGEFLFSTKVAYVKDSVNREVVSVSDQERLDGSAIIAEVLIAVTPEQLESLERSVRNGNKIIIVYSEGEII